MPSAEPIAFLVADLAADSAATSLTVPTVVLAVGIAALVMLLAGVLMAMRKRAQRASAAKQSPTVLSDAWREAGRRAAAEEDEGRDA
jgi:hypothetical protein